MEAFFRTTWRCHPQECTIQTVACFQNVSYCWNMILFSYFVCFQEMVWSGVKFKSRRSILMEFQRHCHFFNSNSGEWSPTGSTRHVGHQFAYCTCPGRLWGWRIWWNDDWQEKSKYSEKPASVPLCSPQIVRGLTGCEPGPPRWEGSD
jgi:hypothetical protein